MLRLAFFFVWNINFYSIFFNDNIAFRQNDNGVLSGIRCSRALCLGSFIFAKI